MRYRVMANDFQAYFARYVPRGGGEGFFPGSDRVAERPEANGVYLLAQLLLRGTVFLFFFPTSRAVYWAAVAVVGYCRIFIFRLRGLVELYPSLHIVRSIFEIFITPAGEGRGAIVADRYRY